MSEIAGLAVFSLKQLFINYRVDTISCDCGSLAISGGYRHHLDIDDETVFAEIADPRCQPHYTKMA